MPDWHNYLKESERSTLDLLQQGIAWRARHIRKLMNRAKQRKHRANRDGR
jgi:hypothetical protein